MKVIGKTKEGFIVDMTRAELGRLVVVGGYYGHSDSDPDVGDTIAMVELYDKAKETIDMHKEALVAAKSLKRAASAFVGYFKEGERG